MLRILTYSYCAGILESRRIYTLLMRDPALRQVCDALEIDDRALRRFRRQHRERLLHCMSAVLEGNGGDPGAGRRGTPGRSAPPGSQALARLHDAILLDQLEDE
jgi:hypothetical protein